MCSVTGCKKEGILREINEKKVVDLMFPGKKVERILVELCDECCEGIMKTVKKAVESVDVAYI